MPVAWSPPNFGGTLPPGDRDTALEACERLPPGPRERCIARLNPQRPPTRSPATPAGGPADTPPDGVGSGGGPGGWVPAPSPRPIGGPVPRESITVDDFGMSRLIAEQLQRMLLSPESRYSPDVLARMKGEAKSAIEGQVGQALRQSDFDLINRGQYDSPEATRLRTEARLGGAQQYGSAVNRIMIEKANADFQDKLAALDRSQVWLDSTRNFALNTAMAEDNRYAIMNQVAQGYQNLELQRLQLQQQWQMFQQNFGLATDQQDFYEWLNTVQLPGQNGGTVPFPLPQFPWIF